MSERDMLRKRKRERKGWGVKERVRERVREKRKNEEGCNGEGKEKKIMGEGFKREEKMSKKRIRDKRGSGGGM